jgi:hypothetical protein
MAFGPNHPAHAGPRLLSTALAAWLSGLSLVHAADTPDFEKEILPLLYSRCFSCHSDKKAKPEGELKLDSVAGIREGVVVVAGAPDESELFKRITLSADDPDRMPPAEKGGVPFDAEEVSLVRRWIAGGANFGLWQEYSHREPARTWGDPGPGDPAALTEHLDRLVDEYHARERITPTNAQIDDSVFARRLYLDIAGRIPTYDELRTFMADPRAERRRALIDRLLSSEAYVSHTFNWWADQLRLLTEHGGGHQWRFYEQWVKEALRARKPLDAFVSQLVTASGYLWESGAAGFYLRDSGMPLDHMSNLTRVFLGTRMECAQCHDHPTEPITQKDFYQLTAYTHGVSVLNKPSGYDTRYVNHWEVLQKRLNDLDASKVQRNAISRAVAPLKRFTTETDEPLKFPATYAYDAAARGKSVSPQTLFGDDAPAMPGRNREAFAQWLVSPRNPRFAPNMANRLWKRVMGLGLVEPVDSLSPFTAASDSALLEFLARTLVQLQFDERAFLAVVLNSRAYQRAAVREDVQPGAPAPFRGPHMRRLTAEQIWDSLLGLLVTDLDQRRNAERFDRTNRSRDYFKRLARMSPEEIFARAQIEHEFLDGWRHFKARKSAELAAAIDQAVAAGDQNSERRLREEQAALDAEEKRRRDAINLGRPYDAPETDPRWLGLDENLIRASELQSPADHGHFLRKFGQSDRREIDASSSAPNLTQSLALMNGTLTRLVLGEESLLRRTMVQIKNPHARLTAVYLAVLARKPSAQEREIVLRLCHGSKSAEADVLWALLNSPEFLFYP